MTDLSAFAEEVFDPKSWINASCAAKGHDEPLDRFLAELEMRLQLGAEEIEASLIECSSAALRRVPFAQQEVSRLRGDVSALHGSTKTLLTSVTADAEAAAAAAAPLTALHTARSNMEAGCATLCEAAELSGAFRRVEEVFAAGDLPRVADMLRNMAKSLALVGDVPEFHEGRGKLAALEDRLQRRVEGRLAEALQANAAQDVASLAALLLAVGRYNSLEAAYVSSRIPAVTAVWDEAAAMLSGSSTAPQHTTSSGLGGGWLLLLYNNLLVLLEQDAAWLGGCLPAQRQQLLVALATAAFERLNKQIQGKLAALHSTKVLAGLFGDVVVGARRIRELLAAAAAAGGPEDVKMTVQLLKLLLEPLEQQVSRYSVLEEPVITAELSAQLPITPSPLKQPQAAAVAAVESEELDSDLAQKLSAACSSAFACLSGVVERCMLLTGGTELPQLLKNLDKQVAGYLQRLQAAVGIITGRYIRLAAAASPSAEVSVMLQLVTLARHVSSKLNSLETLLRSTLAQALPRLQQLAAAGLPPLGLAPTTNTAAKGQGQGQHGVPAAAAAAELLPLRLAVFPGKLGPVGKLQEAFGSSRFMSLPTAAAAGNALCESITTAVYDVLLAPVVSALARLPQQPEWTAAVGAAAAGGGVLPGVGAVVPTFNAYPLPAVTAVGEYLMGLPQQLEVLMSDEQQQQEHDAVAAGAAAKDEEDGDEQAAEWLDKVVRGAGLLYAETLLQIKQLSPSGAAQMAADTEYFCNVMSALAVAPPTALITAQLFAAAPADTFVQMAEGAAAAGSADVKVLKAIAVMRGITWTESAAGSSVATSAPSPHTAEQDTDDQLL